MQDDSGENTNLPKSWSEYRLLVLSNLSEIRSTLETIKSDHKLEIEKIQDNFNRLKMEVEVQKTKIAFAGVIASIIVSAAVTLIIHAINK